MCRCESVRESVCLCVCVGEGGNGGHHPLVFLTLTQTGGGGEQKRPETEWPNHPLHWLACLPTRLVFPQPDGPMMALKVPFSARPTVHVVVFEYIYIFLVASRLPHQGVPAHTHEHAGMPAHRQACTRVRTDVLEDGHFRILLLGPLHAVLGDVPLQDAALPQAVERVQRAQGRPTRCCGMAAASPFSAAPSIPPASASSCDEMGVSE